MPKLYDAVLEQIDKLSNPNRQLGRIAISSPKLINFSDSDIRIKDNITQILWLKRQYIYDRGTIFALSPETFNAYADVKKSNTTINATGGNFTDHLIYRGLNIEYSVDIFVETSRDVILDIEGSLCSVSLYIDNQQQFSSLSGYFSSGKHTIRLSAGWHSLRIYYYSQSVNVDFKVSGDLTKFIDGWRFSDLIPPSSPRWIETSPVVSQYVDALHAGGTKNTLYWYKNSEQDFLGNGIYVREHVQLLTRINQQINVVSGYANGISVPGNLVKEFPLGLPVSLSGSEQTHIVSGTKYNVYNNETIVIMSGTTVSTVGNEPIFFERARHLIDRIVDPKDGEIISWDHLDVKAGTGYTYYLDAFDSKGNRSHLSTGEYILAGDTIPPNPVSGGSYAWAWATPVLTLSWINPTNDDFAGVLVYHQDPDSNPSLSSFASTIGSGVNNIVLTKTPTGTLQYTNDYDFYLRAFDRIHNKGSTYHIAVNKLINNIDVVQGRVVFQTTEGPQELGGQGIALNYGLITAGSYQTASTGKRIIISGTDNNITFYNSSDTRILRIDDSMSIYGPLDALYPVIEFSPNGGEINITSGLAQTYISQGRVNLFIGSNTDIAIGTPYLYVSYNGLDAGSLVTETFRLDRQEFYELANLNFMNVRYSNGTAFVVSGLAQIGTSGSITAVSGIYSPTIRIPVYTEYNTSVGAAASATLNTYIADAVERTKIICSFYKNNSIKNLHLVCNLRNVTNGEISGIKLQAAGINIVQAEEFTTSDVFLTKIINLPISSLSNDIVSVYVKLSGTALGDAEITNPYIWAD